MQLNKETKLEDILTYLIFYDCIFLGKKAHIKLFDITMPCQYLTSSLFNYILTQTVIYHVSFIIVSEGSYIAMISYIIRIYENH